MLYGYRFKIELGFRQAVYVLGAYANRFWMSGMKPLQRGQGDQHLRRTAILYRDATARKMNAFHLHVQLGAIAQGLLQYLVIQHTAEVWRYFRSWLAEYSEALRMTYQQAINIINAQYPAAVVDYEPDLGWRIVSAEDGSEGRIPLGPYCQDYEQAMVAAAKNLSS